MIIPLSWLGWHPWIASELALRVIYGRTWGPLTDLALRRATAIVRARWRMQQAGLFN